MQKRLFSISALFIVFMLAACSQVGQTGQGPTSPATATTTPKPANVYVSTAEAFSTQNVVTALNGATGQPLWNYPTGAGSDFPPAVDQGAVYVGSSDTLAALSAQDGKLLWSYQTTGAARVLGIVNGVVYGDTFNPAVGAKATIFALNASDGSVRWSYQTADFLAGDLLADGVIYEAISKEDCQCSNPHTYLLALSASNGSVKWQTPQGTDHFSLQQESGGLLYGLEAIEEGPAANLQVRHASDGAVAWQFPKDPATVSIIGMDSTALYVLSNDGDFSNFPNAGPNIVYALDATTGATLWRSPLASKSFLIGTLFEQVIYLGSSDGSSLTALNAADGKQLWQAQLGTPGAATNKPVTVSAVVNGTAYVSLPGGFAALKASDGSVQWHAPANGYTFIVKVENGVFYASTSATDTNGGQNVVYALKASDGSSLWRYDVPLIFSPPVVG